MDRLKLSDEEGQSIISLRRKLHQWPELAHTERKTKEILLGAIKDLNLEITEIKDSTGFFADLKVEGTDRIVTCYLY